MRKASRGEGKEVRGNRRQGRCTTTPAPRATQHTDETHGWWEARTYTRRGSKKQFLKPAGFSGRARPFGWVWWGVGRGDVIGAVSVVRALVFSSRPDVFVTPSKPTVKRTTGKTPTNKTKKQKKTEKTKTLGEEMRCAFFSSFGPANDVENTYDTKPLLDRRTGPTHGPPPPCHMQSMHTFTPLPLAGPQLPQHPQRRLEPGREDDAHDGEEAEEGVQLGHVLRHELHRLGVVLVV